jgi:hypothetical protein
LKESLHDSLTSFNAKFYSLEKLSINRISKTCMGGHKKAFMSTIFASFSFHVIKVHFEASFKESEPQFILGIWYRCIFPSFSISSFSSLYSIRKKSCSLLQQLWTEKILFWFKPGFFFVHIFWKHTNDNNKVYLNRNMQGRKIM